MFSVNVVPTIPRPSCSRELEFPENSYQRLLLKAFCMRSFLTISSRDATAQRVILHLWYGHEGSLLFWSYLALKFKCLYYFVDGCWILFNGVFNNLSLSRRFVIYVLLSNHRSFNSSLVFHQLKINWDSVSSWPYLATFLLTPTLCKTLVIGNYISLNAPSITKNAISSCHSFFIKSPKLLPWTIESHLMCCHKIGSFYLLNAFSSEKIGQH